MKFLMFKPILLLVVVAAILIAGCGAPAVTTIYGHVSAALPVAGASIQVQDAHGRPLPISRETTDSAGFFEVRVRHLPSNFRITASGGSVLGSPYDGAFAVEVRDRIPGGSEFYNLGPVTTLVSRYLAAHPDLTLDQARRRVQSFLEVPDFIDLTDGVVNEPGLFDPILFTLEAEANGGFDSFVTALIAQVDTGPTRRFSSVSGGVGGGASAAALLTRVKGGISGLGSVVAGGVGGTIIDMGIGFIIDQLFPSGPDLEQQLEEINARLDEIQAELQKISAQLQEIAGALDEVKRTVNDTNARLRTLQWNEAIGAAGNNISRIDSVYKDVHDVVRLAAIDSEPTKYGPTADAWRSPTGPILDSERGVIFQVRDLNRQIMGQVSVPGADSTPLLTAYLDRILPQVTYASREDAYTSLESFYLGLLTVQLKGVYLVADARRANDQDALARQFVADFYNDMLVPQTELYLSTVERLTLSNMDLRWSQFLPDRQDNYLSRADYLSQELRNGLNPQRYWPASSMTRNTWSSPPAL